MIGPDVGLWSSLLGGASARAQLLNFVQAKGFDSLGLLYAPDTTTAYKDIVKPSRTFTPSGSPVFTPYRGLAFDGSSYLDTNYDPSTNAVNLSQNSNFFGILCSTANADPSGVYEYGQTSFAIAPFAGTKSQLFARGAVASGDFVPQIGLAGVAYAQNRRVSGGFDLWAGNTRFPALYNETNTSKGTNIYDAGSEQQGAVPDGLGGYITTQTGTAKLVIRNSSWAAVTTNASPYSGVPGTINHIGAPDCNSGKVYAPVANYNGTSGPNNNNRVGVYDSVTGALTASSGALTMTTAIGTLSALTVDPVARIIYGADYLDSSALYRVDQDTLTQLSTLTIPAGISSQFNHIQGIALTSGGTFYLSAAPAGGSIGPEIPFFSLAGGFLGVLNPTDFAGANEGIFASGSSVAVMSDDASATAQVYFYAQPSGTQATTINRASGAISGGTMTAGKRNGGALGSTNTALAFWSAAGQSDADVQTFMRLLLADAHSVGAI